MIGGRCPGGREKETQRIKKEHVQGYPIVHDAKYISDAGKAVKLLRKIALYLCFSREEELL